MPRVDPAKLRRLLGLEDGCSRQTVLHALNEKAADCRSREVRDKVMKRGEDLVSLSTLDRIDRGQSVSATTVHLLAAALDVPDRDILATTLTGRSRDELISEVIGEWAADGHRASPEGMPHHPELVYRISGDWKGWNDFFDVPEDHESYAENRAQDALEDDVFALLLLARSAFGPGGNPPAPDEKEN